MILRAIAQYVPRHTHLISRFAAGPSKSTQLAQMTDWLAQLPNENPAANADALARRLSSLRKEGFPTPTHLRMLEVMRASSEENIVSLENILEKSTLPHSTEVLRAFRSLDRLLKQFTDSYLDLTDKIPVKWWHFGPNNALRIATLRAAHMIHRRVNAAYRIYAPASPRRWSQLRKLFLLAQEHQFAQRPVDYESGETVEQIYVRTVLLALMDPATLSEVDFDRLRFYIQRYANLAHIRVDTTSKPQVGILRLSDSIAGARPLDEEQLAASDLILDTRQLLEKLQQQVEGIKAGRQPIGLGLPAQARQADYRFLMKRMLEQWSNPKNRRHERTHFRPLADVVIGFDSVRTFLSHHAFRRRNSDQANPTNPPPGLNLNNDWAAIIDESASGYGLRFSKGSTQCVRIGEILALRSRERSSVHVCIARRALNRDAKEFDLGVELLCDGGLPSSITTAATEKTASERVPVLLLPRVARLSNNPALLAPIGKISKGMSFAVPHKGKSIRLETTATVERLASCELIALRPRQLPQVAGEGAAPQGTATT